MPPTSVRPAICVMKQNLDAVHEVEHDKDTVQLVNLLRLLNALGLHLELSAGAADTVVTQPPDDQRRRP